MKDTLCLKIAKIVILARKFKFTEYLNFRAQMSGARFARVLFKFVWVNFNTLRMRKVFQKRLFS